MFQELYAKSDLLAWPVIGMLIFLTIFVGVLAYVFLGLRDREKIARIASLPFDDEPNAGEAAGELADDLENGTEKGRTR